MDNSAAIKRGYLLDNFRFFHIKDSNKEDFNFHYHEFSKIVILLSGEVSYLIEGNSYPLKPWDLLFVNHHDVHKPIVHSTKPYERIILWINPDYLTSTRLSSFHLDQCFEVTKGRDNQLLRLPAAQRSTLVSLLLELEQVLHSKEYAHELYADTLFLQWMIVVNRLVLNQSSTDIVETVQVNKLVDTVITYINQNLGGDLKLETMASDLFLSSSYLMHQFKKATGSTLHTYITRKRLSNALRLLKEGTPITTAAALSGYSDYTTFLRTFRKYYGCTPSEYLKGFVTMFPNSGKALIE